MADPPPTLTAWRTTTCWNTQEPVTQLRPSQAGWCTPLRYHHLTDPSATQVKLVWEAEPQDSASSWIVGGRK